MENNTETTMTLHQRPTTELSLFSSKDSFEHAQRVAVMLSNSTIVPKDYQNSPANCLVALEMSVRMKDSPLMIMQNLDIIYGRPSFNSKFIIAKLNTCGQFSPLRFEYSGEGDKKQCVAYATELSTNKVLRGPAVSIEMAKLEGWYQKDKSKWKSMPDMMLSYRSATYFGRLYAPELTMGMSSIDESQDIEYSEVIDYNKAAPGNAIHDLNTSAPEEKQKAGRGAARKKTEQPTNIVVAETPTVTENKPAEQVKPDKVTETPGEDQQRQESQENPPPGFFPEDDVI